MEPPTNTQQFLHKLGFATQCFYLVNQSEVALSLELTADPNLMNTTKVAVNINASAAGAGGAYEKGQEAAKDSPVQEKTVAPGSATTLTFEGTLAYLTVKAEDQARGEVLVLKVGGVVVITSSAPFGGGT